MQNIRNFSIIAHIDHGKSTLADRMLDVTKTVEERKMRAQILDDMELERERGITIKLTPVRMVYKPSETRNTKSEILNKSQIRNTNNQSDLTFRASNLEFKNSEYILNLIDTPGHIDFSYEVSRALKACEGTILLVDATQGVQAQTLSTLSMARELGLVIVPVITKIDAPHARVEDVTQEIVDLIGCSREDIRAVSGKTGEGVPELLAELVERIPPPTERLTDGSLQALIFDFAYSEHRGVVFFVRVFSGTLTAGEDIMLCAKETVCTPGEVGVLLPDQKPTEQLTAGEVGYVVTGIKEPGLVAVGDTITHRTTPAAALEGYREPQPVVWASIYPESQDAFTSLRQALARLQLTDSSLSFEEESSSVVGRGFRCGFLGMLHMEIVTERLKREFDIPLVVTTPTITYEVAFQDTSAGTDGHTEHIRTPSLFPEHDSNITVREPWVTFRIMTPGDYLGGILQLLFEHEAQVGDSEIFGDGRVTIDGEMPLRELMRGFFDTLKSVSSGFASLSYELADMRPADVVRLDLLVAEELVPAFSRIVSRRRVQREAESAVERLEKLIPRQLFMVKLQARANGRIIAARRLSALKKNVTGHLYGGDITRKRKLWEKQKKGKQKMQSQGTVHIPGDVYLKMMRDDS